MINFKNLFLLDSDICYLNFGSFGACPKPIMENYISWQYLLEKEPVQFIVTNGNLRLEKSRESLGKYINCLSDELVYVPNPSYAVNIIAKSFNLKKDDEILTTNLEYGACDRTWNYYCQKNEAIYKRQHINLPLINKEKFIEEFFSGLTKNTKAIFISAITSSTALILPVQEICSIAKEKGLITIVDGAHVPGHLPLNLNEIKADFYIGACHKWMMTPKGSSFLYANKSVQNLLDPLVVSWGYQAAKPSKSQFLDYHQMQGTRDFSAFLTIPSSIEFMEKYNWKEVSNQCRKLVHENAPKFCELLNTIPLSPITSEFIGQMFSIPIKTKDPENMQKYLFEEFKIEIPIMTHNDNVYLRYSINAFNDQKDLDTLFVAVEKIKKNTNFIE